MPETSPRTAAWLLLSLAGILLGPGAAAQTQGLPAAETSRSASQTPANPPSPEQLEELTQRVLKNQHRNDLLLQRYERIERDQINAKGKGLSNKDTLAIVVPTGAGEAKVELERNGKASAPAARAQQWRSVAKALSTNTHPNDPDVKREYERAEKRQRERAEMIDALAKAFRFEYAGRESVGGRLLLKATFEPQPGFHSSLRYSGIWKHIHGTIWVDESNAQIVRASGELFDDVDIAGGLILKVYRGSSVTLDQTKVAPGVWFPTHAKIDLVGRLFLLPANYHEQVEDSAFENVGLPEEALQKIFHGNVNDPPQ